MLLEPVAHLIVKHDRCDDGGLVWGSGEEVHLRRPLLMYLLNADPQHAGGFALGYTRLRFTLTNPFGFGLNRYAPRFTDFEAAKAP